MAVFWKKRWVLVVVGCLITCLGFSQGQDPVTVSYEGVWTGFGSTLRNLPVRLTVENTGKAEIVEVKWKDGDTEISTFFDMPKGSVKKRDIYFTNSSGYEPPQIRVKRGFLEIPQTIELGVPGGYGSVKVGLVTDTLGLISAFNEDRKGQFENKAWAEGFSVGVAKPGLAPTRSVGYTDLDILILGEGSERLTDDEVNAIKGAVLTGVRLVFYGGTIQPVLNDPRWRDFLPIVPKAEVEMVSAPQGFRQFANQLPGSTAMLDSSVKSEASVVNSGSFVVMANQTMGAGSVTYMAFDLFGEGWKSWGGRYALIYEMSVRKDSGGWLQYISGTQRDEYDYGYGYSSGYGYGYDGPSADVFGIHVPSSGRIMMVLVGYLVLVVPVNFLVLRKLKKGEWAWFTAPLIALGAAGVLFAFAGQLYSAKASRYASGWLLGSDSTDLGMFVGKQQLFFPGTGRYDLGMEQVESVSSTTNAQYTMFGEAQVQSRFVDFGSIVAPAYEVSNLSFREFGMHQRKEIPSGWVLMSRTGEKGPYVGQVTNPFEEKLENVMVYAGGVQASIGAIEPGDTKTFELRSSGEADAQCWVEAQLSGQNFGSTFGESVGTASVQLLYTVHPRVR